VLRPARLGEIYRIFLSGDLARDMLNWAPAVPLEEGLIETVDWVRLQLATEQGQMVELAATSK
jgi:nucleoside-diphosphate-sugar epimerase